MINSLMQGLAAKDQEKIRNVTENYFAQKLISNLKDNLTYQPAGDAAIDNVFLVDKLFIKGVSTDRDQNDTNYDYV